MSDFWTDLAAKIDNRPDLVQPRLQARFELLSAVEPEASGPVETSEPGPQPQPVVTPPPHIDLPSRHLEEALPQPDHPGGLAEQLSPRWTITEQAAPPQTPEIQAPSPVAAPMVAHAETRPERQGPPGELPPPAAPLSSPPAVPQTRVERVIEHGHAPQSPHERRHVSPETTPISPSPATPVMLSAPPPSPGPEPPEMLSTTANQLPISLIRPKITLPPSQPVIEQVRPDTQAQPSVHVTIGRVDVRAATPPSIPRATPQPPSRFQPPLTLDAYLKRRNGGAS